MRFSIHLYREKGSFLPINYQYELSAAIYHLINSSNSEFAQKLHQQGFIAYGKSFKMFSFSRLQLQGYKVIQNSDRIEHYGREASFEIGFLIPQAAEEFIKGLFINQQISLGDRISKVEYQVSSITVVERPIFQETMRYRCLSPILIKNKRADGGEDHLSPSHEGYGLTMIKNLISKQIAFQNTLQEEEEDKVYPLPEFDFKVLGKVYQKGVYIKQMTSKESKMIGYMFEFELTAPVGLQEIGYFGGFGHLSSQGFGSVEEKGGVL